MVFVMSDKNNDKEVSAQSYSSPQEINAYNQLLELSKNCPIPGKDLHANLGLFLTRASFSRMIFMHELYKSILNSHGVIMEFGTRWGQNLALFTTLRNIYEPYNTSRKIIGFDTFEGFPSVSEKDGDSETVEIGRLAVTLNYEEYLHEVLMNQEQLGPRSEIKKHKIVKGNVMDTLPEYLSKHPETIISLAYLDLTLYEPTKKCLELIRPHLAKNSIVAFDELTLEEYPGETIALIEEWGLSDYEIIRNPISPHQSYLRF